MELRSEERRVGKECRSGWAPVQAEDGIRDGRVTGVQTCALPIWQGVRDQLVEKRRERKWFGEMNMRAFRAFLLSNRTLRMLGMCMGIVGLVDGVIQFSYSRYGVEIGRASCRERV